MSFYKKYIIELEDEPFIPQWDEASDPEVTLYRVKGFNTLVFDENGLNKLKPYIVDPAKESGVIEMGKNIGSASAWTLMQRILHPDYPEGISLDTLKEALGIKNDNVTAIDILSNYAYIDIYKALEVHTDVVQEAIKMLKNNGWLATHDKQVIEDDRLNRAIIPQD